MSDVQRVEALKGAIARHLLRLDRTARCAVPDGREVRDEANLFEREVAELLRTPRLVLVNEQRVG